MRAQLRVNDCYGKQRRALRRMKAKDRINTLCVKCQALYQYGAAAMRQVLLSETGGLSKLAQFRRGQERATKVIV